MKNNSFAVEVIPFYTKFFLMSIPAQKFPPHLSVVLRQVALTLT